MKIRSITYFCDPGWPLNGKVLQQAGNFLSEAKSAFEQSGYEVQTTRLATIPFPLLLKNIEDTPRFADQLSKSLAEIGIDYASVGPALPESPDSYLVIPEVISASKNIFFSGVIADTRNTIFPSGVHACAEVIIRLASVKQNGFANLNFAALANVPPGAPFFPAAYHDGSGPTFAIASEAADLAVEAFSNAQTIDEGRNNLIDLIGKNVEIISRTAHRLKQKFKVRFGGIDTSLAPFPKEAISLGTAFEKMGVQRTGQHGSLAAAAILTEAIDRTKFPRTGFSGLMLPVLEDANLAKRAAEGSLSVKDLLLYSCVCGTGLDTIPLPGDTTSGQISALLLDLAALALRLNKPLTARLMPIPGKKEGDPTNFDFGYFANSRVMELDAQTLKESLSQDADFTLRSRTGRVKHGTT